MYFTAPAGARSAAQAAAIKLRLQRMHGIPRFRQRLLQGSLGALRFLKEAREATGQPSVIWESWDTGHCRSTQGYQR